MSDDFSKDMLPNPGEAIDPRELARRDLKKHLPKRFYAQAAIERDGAAFALALDGRRARTPARNPLAVHAEPLAQALAAEWNAQGEFIDPATMPLTRLIHSALDGVAKEMESVAADAAKYAGSDLLCYRAGDPASLVAEQAQAWDPVLEWMRETHGARFILAEGVTFAQQNEEALAAVRRALDALVRSGEDEGDGETGAALRLASLHVMTTLTGSVLLALATAAGFLDAEAAWTAAHVDEDFQMRAWGEDAEAMARRARRYEEMRAAALVWG
jgi:chaperone required for assembly of F1-ATPase